MRIRSYFHLIAFGNSVIVICFWGKQGVTETIQHSSNIIVKYYSRFIEIIELFPSSFLF